MSFIENRNKIFALTSEDFHKLALEVFLYQSKYCPIYKAYIEQLNLNISNLQGLEQIPFLPIQFFKSHEVKSFDEKEELLFLSSATMNQISSKHFIKKEIYYRQSVFASFEFAFGKPDDYIFLALLPHYLEKKNSSLVHMMKILMEQSKKNENGFYLDQLQDLAQLLETIQKENKKCVLLGVRFALLELAEKFPQDLSNIIIIDTGGMKGRREEMLQEQAFAIFQNAFNCKHIFSEYGMAELMSQAYTRENYFCPTPWQKVFVRDVYDPFSISKQGKGVLNIIDLSNIDSCAFIATDDVAEVFSEEKFSILGRLDYAETRGCNLLLN